MIVRKLTATLKQALMSGISPLSWKDRKAGGTAAGIYALRRLQIGRCGELNRLAVLLAPDCCPRRTNRFFACAADDGKIALGSDTGESVAANIFFAGASDTVRRHQSIHHSARLLRSDAYSYGTYKYIQFSAATVEHRNCGCGAFCLIIDYQTLTSQCRTQRHDFWQVRVRRLTINT